MRLEIAAARAESGGVTGEVIGLDGPYGNLVTNIDAALFATLGWRLGDRVPVTLGTRRLTVLFARTFADVPEGEALLYVDSRNRLALAVNLGNFAEANGVKPPVGIRVDAPRR